MPKYRLKTGKTGQTVIGAYQKVETAVIRGYQTVENCAVRSYKKVEGAFVDRFLERVDDDRTPGSERE